MSVECLSSTTPAEEEVERTHWSSACSQQPPCLVSRVQRVGQRLQVAMRQVERQPPARLPANRAWRILLTAS